MDVATIANVATALTLIAGVGFGLVEAQPVPTSAARTRGLCRRSGDSHSRMDEVDGGGAQHSGWFERVGD